MRLVIDTNVVVSHLFWPDSPIRSLVRHLMKSKEVLRSVETYSELSEVVMRRKFDRYMSIAERELFLAEFYDTSEHVLITERIDACRDPKDNKFLELAVCGKTDLILSGDVDLLRLNPFKGIRIIDPAAFSKL